MTKEILGAAAIVLTFAMFVPYIRSIRRGVTKPHVFSITAYIAVLAFRKKANTTITSSDWTTVLFPAAVGAACVVFVLMVAYRRRQVAPETAA